MKARLRETDSANAWMARACGLTKANQALRTNIARITAQSDARLAACKEAEDTFATFGETEGFPSMGPKCWGAIETLRDVISKPSGEIGKPQA